MGYDLFLRAERTHDTFARIDALTGLLEHLGLSRSGRNQWTSDRDGRWIELYLSTVTRGPDGGDAIDGDGVTFNEVAIHPRPFDLSALSLALRIARHLDWEISDPQAGHPLRDRGAAPVDDTPSLPEGGPRAPLRRSPRDPASPAPSDSRVALTRDPSGFARLVLVDAATGEPRRFRADEILGADDASLCLTCGPGHVFVASRSALHAFSVRTGTLSFRVYPRMRHCAGVAASACGRFVAVCGLAHGYDGDAIVVYDTAGRVVLRVSERALGTTSAPHAVAFHPSGWLAVGLGSGDLVLLGLDGSCRRLDAGRGALRTLVFDGDTLLASTTDTTVAVPLLPDEAGPARPPSEHGEIGAFTFDDTPILARGIDAAFSYHGSSRVAERLAGESEEVLRSALSQARALFRGDTRGLLWGVASVLAEREAPLPEESFVSLLAPDVNDRTLPTLRRLLEKIPDERREEVLFARMEDPAWRRFAALPDERGLRRLLAVLRGLPRGAYTKLKKGSDPLFGYRNGYDAKEFEARAEAALVAFGPGGLPLLEEAAAETFPYVGVVRRALDQLRS